MRDMADADDFARKAKAADAQHTVLPDNPDDFSIPARDVTEMKRARADMLAALPWVGVGKNALYLARAQARFDCWVREREENPHADYTPSCRGAFYTALRSVDTTKSLPVPPPKPVQKHEAETKQDQSSSSFWSKLKPKSKAEAKRDAPKMAKAAPSEEDYTLYFDENSAALNGQAMSVIKRVAERHFDSMDHFRVVLTGYADGVNSEANRKLAARRMVAVKNALILYGAQPDKIDTAHTAIIPESGAESRRVEIVMKALSSL